MKKMLLSLIAGVFLLALCDCFAQEQADAPKYKDGDFWQFTVKEAMIAKSSAALDGVYEVLYRGGKLKIFKLDGNQKNDLVAQGFPQQNSILRWMFGQGSYQGGQSLNFPLFVGKKWTFEYKARPRGAIKSISYSAEIRVAGFEDVSVPAGTFRSLRLVNENSSSPRNVNVYTYHYSPDVKVIVKNEFDFGDEGKREIRLIKFGSAR